LNKEQPWLRGIWRRVRVEEDGCRRDLLNLSPRCRPDNEGPVMRKLGQLVEQRAAVVSGAYEAAGVYRERGDG
jgi:hypothetical protein